jgi:hypothetical protein
VITDTEILQIYKKTGFVLNHHQERQQLRHRNLITDYFMFSTDNTAAININNNNSG